MKLAAEQLRAIQEMLDKNLLWYPSVRFHWHGVIWDLNIPMKLKDFRLLLAEKYVIEGNKILARKPDI